MKYTFEPYKEDGSPRRQIGMQRLPWKEFYEKYINEEDSFAWFYKGNLQREWAAGMHNVPIYEDEDDDN